MASGRRILFRGLLTLLLATTMAGLSSPWWLPHVVRLAGPAVGLSIGAVETHGWHSTTYSDMRWSSRSLSVTARELTVPSLLVFPRVDRRGPDETGAYSIVGNDFEVVIEAPAAPAADEERPEPSLGRILDDLAHVWPQVQRWVPTARLKNISVQSGDLSVPMHQVVWDGQALETAFTAPGLNREVSLELRPSAEARHVAHVTVPSWGATLDLQAATSEGLATLEANLGWRENTARLSAAFPETGWLPERALFEATDFGFDAALIGMDGYDPIQGTARAEWSAQGLAARFSARAQPIEADSALPPLAVELRAVGDLNHVRVEAADVNLPGITATLSEPVELELPRGVPRIPAQFGVTADLEKLPWVQARGQLAGRVSVAASSDYNPEATFSFAGHDLGWGDVALEALELTGRWSWPVLAVEKLNVLLAGGGNLSGNTTIDVAQRFIQSGEVSAQLSAEALAALVADAPPLGNATLSATFSGVLAAPEHLGTFSLDALGGLPGGDLSGTAEWAGTGLNSLALRGELVSAAGVHFPFDASLTRDASNGLRALVKLNELAWIDELGEWWRLASPGAGYIELPKSGGQPRLEIDALRVHGEEFRASADAVIDWPGRGTMSVQVADFMGSRLKAWVPDAYTRLEIDNLEFDASWDHGPVRGNGTLRASYHVDENTSYTAEVDFEKGGEKNLAGEVRILDETGVVARGTGQLPIEITGTDDGFRFRLIEDAPLSLELKSEPNELFWQSVREWTGWDVKDPVLDATLIGSFDHLEGSFELTASRVVPAPKAGGLMARVPEFADLAVRVAAEPDELVLDTASVAIAGRRVEVAGRAPWDVWGDLVRREPFRWNETNFRFSTDPLPLAILARLFPAVVVPEGEVRVDLEHRRAEGFDGSAWLTDAALRPIPALGAVREIGGEMSVHGYTVELSRLDAKIGGRTLTISGDATIRPGARPVFDVRLQGSRLPLVRSAGLILRTDLDLRVTRVDERPAEVTGEVNLGPSVFFSDLASLLGSGGGMSSPVMRPPYFSVSSKPLSDWRLDVEIYGDRFLQLDVPAMRGRVSADFHLEGTLGQPRAIGRASLDEAIVAFPFASVPLDSAEVTLLASDPYTPRIHALGHARAYGYELRMEVTGTANDPQVRFTGDPPITSQEALLMLTAGELPRSARTFSSSERAQRLAFYMGRTLVSGFGLSDIGAESRLDIRSSEQFTQQGRETIYVQFDLDKRWSLVGEYDRWDAYNGGIKFRILEK